LKFLAKEMGLFTIALTGRGGKLAEIADITLRVSSDSTPRIQETHIIIEHLLCDLVDRHLFPESF